MACKDCCESDSSYYNNNNEYNQSEKEDRIRVRITITNDYHKEDMKNERCVGCEEELNVDSKECKEFLCLCEKCNCFLGHVRCVNQYISKYKSCPKCLYIIKNENIYFHRYRYPYFS